MSTHAESIRLRLSSGPLTARQLAESMGISQPTVSRTLAGLGDDIVRIGAARSIRYALRDTVRGLPDIPIHRVDSEGRITLLGTLVPVRPDGFVMHQTDGATLHSESLPWWLMDMRPQGFLGRAHAARHGAALGLPARLADWNDTHALRALLAHGHDMVGNLLVGEVARDRFLSQPLPAPIADTDLAATYVRLAAEAAQGDAPGSSAGGEQPKFTACAMTPAGPRHVIVKFSEVEDSPVSERWRDLLRAEHLALSVLREAGIPAALTTLSEHGGQRFLQVERFDRVGPLGRRTLLSLTALDAEFVGAAAEGWPVIVHRLARDRHIAPEAAAGACLLWAFGTLIGNTDMHGGNLSFVAEQGRPYALAPAYDMTPMAFAPRSGGGLPDTVPEAVIHAGVAHDTWRQAEALARAYLARVSGDGGFSARFAPCVAALVNHLDTASARIARLG
ncbi:MAG: type II toxin-antitoxin system HipA family toxin YjjJ [Methyloversatilis sp.]|jgi:hypothetical protein|nr:type II toxin-antitoxin system HipA family toxin YjjJ [Methyloversatilis sp.]